MNNKRNQNIWEEKKGCLITLDRCQSSQWRKDEERNRNQSTNSSRL